MEEKKIHLNREETIYLCGFVKDHLETYRSVLSYSVFIKNRKLSMLKEVEAMLKDMIIYGGTITLNVPPKIVRKLIKHKEYYEDSKQNK